MKTHEFSTFQRLLGEVYLKAFGEPLSPLTYGRAQALSWLIEEATGQVLSYKTLSNYVKAATGDASARVNPNASTLAILVRYLHGQAPANDVVAWTLYSHAIAC
ncbi:MAG: hypothetical protein RMJ33_06735 [Saprospiraceae bacterium]|nr:hypothetical protein [Saprospiraceae bacterium]MDW8229517.1 hypothetical protein [Saprospiraceae bacterium]